MKNLSRTWVEMRFRMITIQTQVNLCDIIPKSLFPNARQMLKVIKSSNMHKMRQIKSKVKCSMSVLIRLNETADRQFPEESASKHRAEIADVHSHDS